MTKNLSTISLLGYSIYSGNLSDCVNGNKTLINTVNQYSYCIAESDPVFKKALQESDVLLPDGTGITAAMRLLNNRQIKKIAGADIHRFLLEDLNKKGGKCFYLGSSKNTLDKISKNILKDFPNIRLKTFSPPYKDKFSEVDNQQMIDELNSFMPDVLFIGMTAPKQEKWAYEHKNRLNAEIICSIGAVFDFYAGTITRPNKIWISLGLEWFARLLKEPKRMWKRYLYYGPIFIKLILLEKVRNVFKLKFF